MSLITTSRIVWCALIVALLDSAAIHAQEADDAEFYRAAYLQTEQRDYGAAAELFAQVAQSAEASEQVKESAAARLVECREEMAARDLASLMPADSFAYVQLANVGDQLAKLLNAAGLAGGPTSTGNSSPRIPLEEGFSLPLDFQLSPALVRELGRVGGAAASIVSISDRGVPEGLIAIHLGDSDLLRGLAETGLQVLPPQESLGGYATYRIPVEDVEIWLVQTSRLMLLSTSRDQVAAAVGRLQHDAPIPRLSTTTSFSNAASERRETMLYAWADAQRAAPIIEAVMREELRGEELAVAQTVLGLRQLESASLSVGATNDGARAEAAIRFQPDHHHLIYGLLRTAPIGTDAFKLVPKEAAAIASFGLNPPAATVGSDSGTSSTQQGVALMDIGRELFANVESVTVFALPGSSPKPDFGVVVKARDGAKSKQLWNQLLSLPTLFGVLPPQATTELQLGDRSATQYQFPDAPPIVVVQPNDGALLVGTPHAVEASLNAADTGVAVDQHPQLGPVIREASDSTSKAVFVSIADALQCARPMMSSHEQREVAQIAAIIEDLTVGFTVDEAPAEFRIRLEVSGVPQISKVLKTLARERGIARTAAAQAVRRQVVVVRDAPAVVEVPVISE